MRSLLDYQDRHPVDVWCCFRDLHTVGTPLWGLLKPGFQHVDVWREQDGVWLLMAPFLEYAQVQAYADPPWMVVDQRLRPTFMRVRRAVQHRRVREWFHVGPMTCVELTKAFLGLRATFVRTPWQLYKLLRK